jgi:hypothetical protein
MADPISLAAGLVAVLQLTDEVINCLHSTNDASGDRQRILDEITGIHYLFYRLNDRAPKGNQDKTIEPVLTVILPQFELVLERLMKRLQPAKGLAKIGKSLTWPFRKREVTDLLSTFERVKSLLSLALLSDHL